MNLSNLSHFNIFSFLCTKRLKNWKLKFPHLTNFHDYSAFLTKFSYVFSSKMSGKVNALLDSGFSQLFLLFHCAVKSEWELGILWRRRKTIHDIRKVEKWNLWPRKCCCLLSCFRVRTLMLRKIQKVRNFETLDFLKLFYTRTGEHWYATSTWLSQWDISRSHFNYQKFLQQNQISKSGKISSFLPTNCQYHLASFSVLYDILFSFPRFSVYLAKVCEPLLAFLLLHSNTNGAQCIVISNLSDPNESHEMNFNFIFLLLFFQP